MGATHEVDEPVVGVLDRVARAKEALRKAEERTGARTLRIVTTASENPTSAEGSGRAVPAASPTPQRDGDAPAPQAQRSPARAALRRQEPGPTERLSSNERQPLPVPAPLREILPEGLRRGSVTVVSGSTSLLLSLIAESSQAGSWAALVGAPSINLLAAAQAGIDLTRLVLVPGPGMESATTVAALLDGMDIVVVGPEVVMVDSDRRRLAARARERASVILTMRPWQGAGMTLTAERSRWSGLEAGHGRLRSRVLTVTRSGRSGAGVPLRRELWLPREAGAPVTAQSGPPTSLAEGASAALSSRPATHASPTTHAGPTTHASPSPLAQVG